MIQPVKHVNMKKSILLPLIGVILSIAAIQSTKMIGSQSHPEGFHFFHSIHLDDDAIMTKSYKVIQPLMLSKDHDYDFVLKNIKSNVIVTIIDDRGQTIATNYDEKTDTYYKSLVFESHITEFYHIEIKSDVYQKGGQCVVYSKCHEDKKGKCKY